MHFPILLPTTLSPKFLSVSKMVSCPRVLAEALVPKKSLYLYYFMYRLWLVYYRFIVYLYLIVDISYFQEQKHREEAALMRTLLRGSRRRKRAIISEMQQTGSLRRALSEDELGPGTESTVATFMQKTVYCVCVILASIMSSKGMETSKP